MESAGTMEQVLTAMAASVMHSTSGMSKWNMADLTLGIYKLSGRHQLEGAVDTIAGTPIVLPSELEDMLEWLQWAKAAYKRDQQSLATAMRIREEDIVKLVSASDVMKPAFYIVKHHRRRCVVMGIRGTSEAYDVLTDLNPHSESFEGGYAHSGMLTGAQWLLRNEAETVHNVLQENPGFRLVLTGHSLGAGSAALLGLMLRETSSTDGGNISNILKIPNEMITCWGFGSPPCVNHHLAITSPFITNVVLQDDVVARVSPAALEDLRSEIAQTEWSQAFKDGSTQRQFVDMVQETTQRVSALPVTPHAVAVFNTAKEKGLSKLLSAGNALVSQVTGKNSSKIAKSKAGAWLSIGAAAAGTFLNAAQNRVSHGVNKSLSAIEEKTRKSDQQVAAAALATHAAASASKTKDELLRRRLYVPGTLCHILRQLVPPGMTLVNAGDRPRKFTHTVIKGTDPNSRFGRIVLSNTMFSDHSIPAYVDAAVDALQCASRSYRSQEPPLDITSGS